jgi:hypothetical protein
VAIVDGFFTPEEDVKRFEGRRVVLQLEVGARPAFSATGTLLGPFGKGGKCKVSFDVGSAHLVAGARVEMA